MDEFNQAVERLRSVFAKVNSDQKFKEKLQARDEVLLFSTSKTTSTGPASIVRWDALLKTWKRFVKHSQFS
jgi:hypothetical protein